MKKLEKMDGKLFESLKPNEMSNLGALVGGHTQMTTKDQQGCPDTWKQESDPRYDGFTSANVDVIHSEFKLDGIVIEQDKNPVEECTGITLE